MVGQLHAEDKGRQRRQQKRHPELAAAGRQDQRGQLDAEACHVEKRPPTMPAQMMTAAMIETCCAAVMIATSVRRYQPVSDRLPSGSKTSVIHVTTVAKTAA